MDLGGIITGSRALKFYHYNGAPLLDRSCDDWDIIIPKGSLMQFCTMNKIFNVNFNQEVIRVNFNTGMFTGYNSYSDSAEYIFKHEFDILAKEKLPEFNQIGIYRIAKLETILDEKIKLIKESSCKSIRQFDTKHFMDCNEVMMKVRTSEII